MAILVAFGGCLPTSANSDFCPQDFPKHHVVCKALKRAPNNKVVNISLSALFFSLCAYSFAYVHDAISLGYVDINPKANETLLMVHGWPGLWSTWARQIEEFKV